MILVQDHPLPVVTAVVEQAAMMVVFSYEVVMNLLNGQSESAFRQALLPVWPSRMDHFDQLVHG